MADDTLPGVEMFERRATVEVPLSRSDSPLLRGVQKELDAWRLAAQRDDLPGDDEYDYQKMWLAGHRPSFGEAPAEETLPVQYWRPGALVVDGQDMATGRQVNALDGITRPLLSVGQFLRSAAGLRERTLFGGVREGAAELAEAAQSAVRGGTETAKRLATSGEPVLEGLFETATGEQGLGEIAEAIRGAGIPQAENIPEGLVRGIAQFMIGYGPAKAAMRGGRLSAFMKDMLAGGVADMGVFDPNEGNLSNLLTELGWADNEVTRFLSTNPDDPELVNRLKNTLEGAGLGVLTPLALRAARKHKEIAATTAGAALSADAAGGDE